MSKFLHLQIEAVHGKRQLKPRTQDKPLPRKRFQQVESGSEVKNKSKKESMEDDEYLRSSEGPSGHVNMLIN